MIEKCPLCRERAVHPGAVVLLGDQPVDTCLECRRIEIQTNGVCPPDRYDPTTDLEYHSDPQSAFEQLMQPLGLRVNNVRHRLVF